MYHLLAVPSRALQSLNTTEQGSTPSIGYIQQNRSFHLNSYDDYWINIDGVPHCWKRPSLQKLAESNWFYPELQGIKIFSRDIFNIKVFLALTNIS